jgi:hypothetical protein
MEDVKKYKADIMAYLKTKENVSANRIQQKIFF